MRANTLPALILLILLSSNDALSQQFGGNPSSLRWNQIDTDTVRVIFPEGLEQKATEVAEIVHRLAALEPNGSKKKPGKVDMVLQNQTTVSNGYVSLGPFRSELYLTPEQNSFELGSLPWHKSLALHEYRHVQQFNNYRVGLSRLFFILFGEEGQALANSTAVPDWFWEGDAVYHETILSNQGRGRLPYFFNPYRSLWAAGKEYSWMKLRNGSYRDFVPDHYKLGYLLVRHGRRKFEPIALTRTSREAAAFRPLLYPFQNAFYRNSGMQFREFRSEALDSAKEWSGTHSKADAPSRMAAAQKHFFADMEFPQWAGPDSILFVRSSYRAIPAFYVHDRVKGTDARLFTRHISQDNQFSYSNGKIVYSAFQKNPRRGWVDYRNLRMIDLHTGRYSNITRKTKYFSPDISSDGKTIAAVHVGSDGRNEIRTVDVHTGNVLQSLPNPDNLYYTHPKFFKAGEIVAAARNGDGKMGLGIFNVTTGETRWIVPFTNRIIAFPNIRGDTISFSMTEGNQDRLFIWTGGRIFRFEPDEPNVSTGDYQLASNGEMHAWTRFTAVGQILSVGRGRFTELKNLPWNSGGDSAAHYLNEGIDIISGPVSRAFEVKKYPAAFELFNFHSRRPYINDPDYSFSIVGQNILNTMLSEVYLTYNRNEKFKELGAAVAYGKWFPELRGGLAYTFDRSFTDSSARITWNELNANAGVTIPLSFVNGPYFQDVDAGFFFNTKQLYYTGASKQAYENKQFNFADLRISFTNQRLKAKQHIYPRFAQAFSVRYRTIVNKYKAHQLFAGGSFFLPGLFTNHSFVLQAAYQGRDTLQQYVFSNSFPLSRGYSDINLPQMWKLGVNYHLPVAYPDRGFGNIVYILRVRTNLFYDYMEAKSQRTGTNYAFRSAGCELYFDSKWWNQLPLSLGLRYSRLLDGDILGMAPNRWEFILPLNLLSR